MSTDTGLKMTGRKSFDQMRLRSIGWGQMEGNGAGKSQVRVSVIGWLKEP